MSLTELNSPEFSNFMRFWTNFCRFLTKFCKYRTNLISTLRVINLPRSCSVEIFIFVSKWDTHSRVSDGSNFEEILKMLLKWKIFFQMRQSNDRNFKREKFEKINFLGKFCSWKEFVVQELSCNCYSNNA